MTLRQAREDAGLTQRELARRAGITPSALSLIERGLRTRTRYETKVALARALGHDPITLFPVSSPVLVPEARHVRSRTRRRA